MDMCFRPARINVKALLVLVVVLVVAAGAAAGGYKIRKRIIASTALAKGRAACAQQDWPTACKELKRYLERYPDDIDVLRQYGEAHLAVRPLEAVNVSSAIAAYRRLLRLDPSAELAAAGHKRLATLYEHTGNFDELAYIA